MPAVNKIIYNGRTLIDLTADTVTADSLLAGYTAHKADGSVIMGSLDPDYYEVGNTASSGTSQKNTVSKVVFGTKTLIDLTKDTVVPQALLQGCTAHRADGTLIVGVLIPASHVPILDSQGGYLLDSSGDKVKGTR